MAFHDELWEHAKIRVNQGKTQVWNRCGDHPPNCEHNTDGELNNAWQGDHDLPTDSTSSKQRSPRRLNTEPSWRESGRSRLQCAWILLLHCTRANHLLLVHPALSLNFAVQHDARIRQCLEDLAHTSDERDVGDGQLALQHRGSWG